MAAQLFDGYYFAHGCGRPYARDTEWQAHFGGIADAIVRELQPSSVLDVGCAIGLLVEALRVRGVEAYGVDVSEYSISQVHASIRNYCTLGRATEPFGRRYDLIVCIEVLEHLPPKQAQIAIANFCRHADKVLFSSSPFDYVELTHFNVQPPHYWARLFAQQGFFRDVDLDAGFLTPWAACYQRRSGPPAAIVADYERRHWLMLQESRARLQVSLEQREQLAALEQELAGLRNTGSATQQAGEVQALRAQLDAIDSSAGGHLLRSLQSLRARLAPPGTLRDQVVGNVLQRVFMLHRTRETNMLTLPLDTETLAACPICAGNQLHTVETVPDAYIPLLILQQCAQCGVICLNPRLTHESVLTVENESTVYTMTEDEAEQIVAGPLTQLAQYLTGFVRSPGRRWLDIGCNRGLLLETGRRLGWQPMGVEIAVEAAQRARQKYGLTVHADLDAIAAEPPFDLITAWHVLEHTTDPVGFLRTAAGKLAPGGVLALQVPAYDYRSEFASRGQLGSLICTVHNFYFSADGLRQVLSRTDLHPLTIEVDPQHLLLTAVCTNRTPSSSLGQRLRRWLHLA